MDVVTLDDNITRQAAQANLAEIWPEQPSHNEENPGGDEPFLHLRFAKHGRRDDRSNPDPYRPFKVLRMEPSGVSSAAGRGHPASRQGPF
jgi:hypothetical protein